VSERAAVVTVFLKEDPLSSWEPESDSEGVRVLTTEAVIVRGPLPLCTSLGSERMSFSEGSGCVGLGGIWSVVRRD
jgi:hypothetical protein